jgi:uncharacterized membrane protein
LVIGVIFFLLETSRASLIIFISFIFTTYLANTIILLGDILKYYKTLSNGS